MPQIFDSLPLTNTRLTRDGYLVGEVLAGRIGIQDYAGFEVGRPDLDRVKVYRPEEEVFKDEAMASFTSLPITVDHPPELVSAKNWKHFAVGFTGESVARDGGFVRIPLALKDAASIDKVAKGEKRELSFGYTCDMDFTPGTTPQGQQYDAVQRNPRGNHLAIVSKGRAGSECRIGDSEDNQMPDAVLRMIQVDGIPVQTTDAGAQVIETLNRRVADHVAANLKLTTDHQAALTAKDAEVATLRAQLADKDKEAGAKDAEIGTLKGQVSDAAAIDRMVAERSDVIAKAKSLDAAFDAAGKSNAEIHKAVVQKVLGDSAVVNRSSDYIMASFDRLVEMRAQQGAQQPHYGQQAQDAFRQSMQNPPAGTGAPVDKVAAYNQLLTDNANAWQHKH